MESCSKKTKSRSYSYHFQLATTKNIKTKSSKKTDDFSDSKAEHIRVIRFGSKSLNRWQSSYAQYICKKPEKYRMFEIRYKNLSLYYHGKICRFQTFPISTAETRFTVGCFWYNIYPIPFDDVSTDK
jgi:hypothetical protein